MSTVKQELAAILSEARGKRWQVTKGKKYWKLWCPNPCKCRKTVHLTPSDPRYVMNLRHVLARVRAGVASGGQSSEVVRGDEGHCQRRRE